MAMATYHPVVGLGEAPGERVDAVGDVGERREADVAAKIAEAAGRRLVRTS